MIRRQTSITMVTEIEYDGYSIWMGNEYGLQQLTVFTAWQ